ncbi:MAG: DNA helicase UvrD [Candidatus Magasanikbacteria bacterium]|nr:DNA helicase UvrD [Candidatus Magasanikbacteria bacterium]
MIEKILDLHIHSKYSRACSGSLVLPNIAKECELRGIDVVSTGDFTHPAWFEHIKDKLVEDAPGIFRLNDNSSKTRFILGTEVASIKKHAGKTRRVHLLIFAPSIASVEKFNNALESRGCNLRADGRPILGLTCKEILSIMLEIDSGMVMIPAHAWTPWFGVFGSKGGYDRLEECFEDLSSHINAIETGLSSDPIMNRRCSCLDSIALISNSDAHSLQKLGREANIVSIKDEVGFTFAKIFSAIKSNNRKNFLSTIEFYPEEGKYHLDGHAVCNFVCTPEETKKYGGLCPSCKKQLTIGVMNRISELSDRSEMEAKIFLHGSAVPFQSLVPLREIIADVLKKGVATKSVSELYNRLLQTCGSEFFLLREATLDNIAKFSTPRIAEAVHRVRVGRVHVRPGYDGVFGVVKIFVSEEKHGDVSQGRLLLDL